MIELFVFIIWVWLLITFPFVVAPLSLWGFCSIFTSPNEIETEHEANVNAIKNRVKHDD